jgi:Mn-dependent DtxR family transcriptional regulator
MHLTLPGQLVDGLPQLSGGAVKTLIALSWLKTTRTPRPTQRQIAEHMGAAEKSVFTYLNELERAGYIERKRLRGGMNTDYVLLSEITYAAK